MQSLSALKSGELSGIKKLTLSEGLTHFPLEILSLADSLEILDLSNNQLTHLPPEIAQLKKLRILFASNNPFEELPPVLGQCENLEMVGFKSNQIQRVSGEALPAKLRWLILTNNKIEQLPDALGQRPNLQKLALAGNRLTSLPNTLDQSHNLELIRISANNLTAFPRQLLSLPKLAWLAFAGNPFCQETAEPLSSHAQALSSIPKISIPKIASSEFTLGETLGQGASGIISKAQWRHTKTNFPSDIAVKVFKGEVTSDGYPQDELKACLHAGKHPNLVEPLAQVSEDECLALVMSLIPNSYQNLGLPPTLETCTRDTFTEGLYLPLTIITQIVEQMVAIFEHLHAKHICHGDLYAHNTLFNENGHIIFGDFGAASIYSMLSSEEKSLIKQIEARSLNHFIDDLLSICDPAEKNIKTIAQFEELKLKTLSIGS